MSIITQFSGRAVPVRGNDIDTDRIIPARFLRCVTFDGLGKHAFADDRTQETAQGRTHPFDQTRFSGATVLVVNSNFGCGSSREHAPQAIARWGVKAIVGVSFSEIFYGNCVAMGVPILMVSAASAEALQTAIEADPSILLTLDIDKQIVTSSANPSPISATIPPGIRQQFVTGTWDALGQLVAALPDVRKAASKIPYMNGFA